MAGFEKKWGAVVSMIKSLQTMEGQNLVSLGRLHATGQCPI